MKCFQTVKIPLQSKALLIMKLTAVFMLSFALNVSAHGFGQEKISLRMKKTEISGVLRTIEKQTNYRFLYNDNLEDIREKVSIEVMKDPSSLAIFGVRGGTGVIAITTKKAKAGQTLINYSGTYGIKNLVDKIEMASAAQPTTGSLFRSSFAKIGTLQ